MHGEDHGIGCRTLGGLWGWAARGAHAGVIGAAAPQAVARVVEVHDRLEALEVAIVSVRFDEAWIRSLVHIAQRWHLKSPHVLGCQRAPASINRGGVAKQIVVGEKTADAGVDIL